MAQIEGREVRARQRHGPRLAAPRRVLHGALRPGARATGAGLPRPGPRGRHADPGAHLTGAHLRLPGHGPTGPTLEIYQYDAVEPGRDPKVDRAGWGHIAFQVPDVPAALDAVVAAGGGRFGEVVTLTTSDGRHVTWCYATDPDGNLVELQAWS